MLTPRSVGCDVDTRSEFLISGFLSMWVGDILFSYFSVFRGQCGFIEGPWRKRGWWWKNRKRKIIKKNERNRFASGDANGGGRVGTSALKVVVVGLVMGFESASRLCVGGFN